MSPSTLTPAPRVSIGMPVHNGASGLAGAIDSLIGQDFRDIEIVISENASTDGTAEICAAYAARDPRIRVVTQPSLLVPADNFMAVLAEARAPYFMWAAHDDRRDLDLVGKLVAALEAEPSSILAYGDIAELTADGLKPVSYAFDNRGLGPAARFALLARRLEGFQIYGLWQTEALRRVPFADIAFGPDKAFLMAAAATGDFLHVPGPRLHWHRSTRRALGWAKKGVGDDLRRYAHLVGIMWEYLATVARSVTRVAGPWRGLQAFAIAGWMLLVNAAERALGKGRV